MSEIITMDGLRSLLSNVLDVDEDLIGEDTHFINDLGVDSLMSLEVMVTLERRFKIKLSESDLKDMARLRDVYTLLNQKVQVASSETIPS